MSHSWRFNAPSSLVLLIHVLSTAKFIQPALPPHRHATLARMWKAQPPVSAADWKELVARGRAIIRLNQHYFEPDEQAGALSLFNKIDQLRERMESGEVIEGEELYGFIVEQVLPVLYALVTEPTLN
jgi:hypothetical protein